MSVSAGMGPGWRGGGISGGSPSVIGTFFLEMQQLCIEQHGWVLLLYICYYVTLNFVDLCARRVLVVTGEGHD